MKYDAHYFARHMTLEQIGTRIWEVEQRLARGETALDRQTLRELRIAVQIINAKQAGVIQ